MTTGAFNIILEKLTAYKKKYYTNVLLRGMIFFFAVIFTAWLLFSSLEYFGRFNTPVRLAFFFGFLSIAGFALYKWVATPIIKLVDLKKQISDEEAATQIGKYFPNVSDKLLNALQLKKLSTQQNDLLLASINQKTSELSFVPFTEAVSFKENKKHLKYVAVPIVIILLLLIFVPQMLTEGTNRIVNYNTAFIPKAPFDFKIANPKLEAFKNEDFEVKLQLAGNTLPDQVYLISKGKRSKMKKEANGDYSYTFRSIQRDEAFTFEAGGFTSLPATIHVISRPDLRYFDTYLSYPSYLGKKNEALKNAGNLTVPEGTQISWEFGTADAERINLSFSSDGKNIVLDSKDNQFKFSRRVLNSEDYHLQLENSQSKSKEEISYNISVVKDQFPVVNVEKYNDTVLYNYISLGGKISDDYGLRALKLFYRIKNKEKKEEQPYRSVSMPIDANSPAQNFYYNWMIDSLDVKPGEALEYFVQVWDNDGVNGSKSSKSGVFEFKLPSEKEIEKDIKESSNQAENKMEKMLDETLQLQREINKLQQKMKNQKTLSWQEKKDLENVLKKHEELKKEMEQLSKQNEQLSEKIEKFSPQEEQTAAKMMELQKLFNELLDDETRKMYEELQKMLNDKASKEMIDKMLEKMEKKDEALNQDLDRALELFKQLKFEQKLNDAIKDLDKLAEKQEKLSEKTSEKDKSEKADEKDKNNQQLSEEQQKLNEEFKDLKEELKELKDINESLEEKKEIDQTGQDEQSVDKEQQDSKEELGKNQKGKAAKSQKTAADKMKQMSAKLSKMKQDSAEEEAEENLADLRAILENLLTLSFDQEALMKDFKKVSQSDPRYIQLAQKQLKLKDDSKVIEDSLMSLAKRVFQIQSFVTREVRLMKGYMDESVDAIKARRSDLAAGKQQFSMTSINNLALMLNDVLKQMQQQMADSKQPGGGGQCKKPGKSKKPGLSDLQKQLNQSMEQLKKGGKTGRQLSEELAKMAAQQEMIRKALKEMEGKMGKNGKDAGNQLSEMKKMMEESEKDLVNKRLTQETIMRQQDILSKLLESEKAARERELDEKREAEKANELKNEVPPSFEKYLKAKEKQIDLLKTVPPSLNPYYKQEVNEYFQKLEK
jgi:hypothetical protein